MKNVITIAAGTLALSVATRAALAAPPEYNRGYNDCLAGRDDGGVADHGHQITVPPRLRPQHAEAALGVVEGDPLDKFRKDFLGR